MGPEIVYKNNNSNLQGCIIATEYFILINSIEYSYKIMKNSNNYICVYTYIYTYIYISSLSLDTEFVTSYMYKFASREWRQP